MRLMMLGAVVLCLALFMGHQAESRDTKQSAEVHPFEDALFQSNTQSDAHLARSYPECGFKGQARSEGTPMVINGHNGIRSLKVPAGQCMALFTGAGYNDEDAGEMLMIHGPMTVSCLSALKLRNGQATWLQATQSYKMGPCAATPTAAMATAAVKTAASSTHDLRAISAAAKKAAEGRFGSIVSSFTKVGDEDGVAEPYDPQTLVHHALSVLETGQPVDTITPDSETEDSVSYPYAAHTVASEVEEAEDEGETDGVGPPPHTEEEIAAHEKQLEQETEMERAAGSSLDPFQWKHEHIKDEAWKKFHVPFPELPSPVAFDKSGENSPIDDAEDLIKDAKRNSVGCDPMVGCREPPPPCADRQELELCRDYVANGDCQYDFVQRDCQKACGLCPGATGSISDDAYTGDDGHYYLGSARRRIGAGFGRRRRSPTPAPTEGAPTGSAISTKWPDHTHVEKVAPSVLHPDGVTVVHDLPPAGKPYCEVCVSKFEAAGGCAIWQSGGDPTSVVPKGCLVCAEEAATHCGMPEPEAAAKDLAVKDGTSTDDAGASLPEPLEHPKAAAAQMATDAAEATAEDAADSGVPATVAEAAVTDAATAATSAATEVAHEEAAADAAPEPPATTEEAEAAAQKAESSAAATATSAAAAQTAVAQDQAAASTAAVAAAQAEGTSDAEATAAVAQHASKVAAASQAAAASAQATASDSAVTAATAAATAASGEAADAATTPPPTPPPPTEDEIIAEKAHDWAAEKLAADEAGGSTVDTVVPEA